MKLLISPLMPETGHISYHSELACWEGAAQLAGLGSSGRSVTFQRFFIQCLFRPPPLSPLAKEMNLKIHCPPLSVSFFTGVFFLCHLLLITCTVYLEILV